MSKYEYRITIIVPFYNTSEYLKKCLDSLLHQTISSIEIIVVDDCSTEDTEKIYAEYASCKNIIFLRNEQRLGPGGARNRGIEIAHGEYIGFCDSDDWVELDTYRVVTDSMDEYNCDIGLISMQRIYNYPITPACYICHYDKYYKLNSDMALQILFGQYDVGISIPYHCTNKIFRKEFLKKLTPDLKKRYIFKDGYSQYILF